MCQPLQKVVEPYGNTGDVRAVDIIKLSISSV